MVDFIRVPPDSTGKRMLTQEHVIDDETVQIQNFNLVSFAASGLHGTTEDHVHTLEIDHEGAAYTRFTEGKPSFDGFNRMRLSQTSMVGYYEFSVDEYADLFWVDLQTGGTKDYRADEASIMLTTNGTNGSKAELTTNRYHYNILGSSIYVIIAASCGDTGKANNSRKWGYFDDERGRFFVVDENGFGVGRRSNITGSPVDYVTYQADFNVDPLDGTGQSAITLDVTKMYLYWIDWSFPANQTRFGVFTSDGERVVCHIVETAGANAYPYTLDCHLPIRWSNIDSGVVGSSSELRAIVAGVYTENNELEYTFWRHGDISSYNKLVNAAYTPVLSVKSKAAWPVGRRNTVNVFPDCLNVYVSGGPVQIDVISHNEVNSLLTNDTWSVEVSASVIGDSTATAIDNASTDYWVTHSFYIGPGVTNLDLKSLYELNDEGILLSADGINSGIISYVAKPLTGAPASVSMTLSVRELW
jgi:hypothetical protein